MRKSTAGDLLDLWERASRCGPQERALHLLAWALPDRDLEALADLDLGLRDWHLLRLRRALFGPALAGHTDCPHCGERIEIELDARTLQDDAPPPQAPPYVCRNGRRFRLPTSHDLIAIANVGDVEAAARELFMRCGLDPSETIDRTALEEVDDGLAAMAAERSVQFEFACVCCGESWQLTFDPGMFLWEETEARAAALFDEVHRIASVSGWSESEILALGDTRRAAYLSRVN